jgi:hypothetical protein
MQLQIQTKMLQHAQPIYSGCCHGWWMPVCRPRLKWQYLGNVISRPSQICSAGVLRLPRCACSVAWYVVSRPGGQCADRF